MFKTLLAKRHGSSGWEDSSEFFHDVAFIFIIDACLFEPCLSRIDEVVAEDTFIAEVLVFNFPKCAGKVGSGSSGSTGGGVESGIREWWAPHGNIAESSSVLNIVKRSDRVVFIRAALRDGEDVGSGCLATTH